MVSFGKKQLACSILLLAGCQSDPGRLSNQTHTDDLIDLYLSQSATTIQSMQTQLYPSPAKPIAHNSSELTAAPHAATNYVVATPSLQTVANASSLAFIAHDGKNQTLSNAIKDIIPGSWHFTISPRISGKKKVSWTGNDQWPYVLNRLAKNYGWYAAIDWNTHSVTISDVPVASVTPKPTLTASAIVTAAGKPAAQSTGTKTAVIAHPVHPLSQSEATVKNPTTLQPPTTPVVTGPFKSTTAVSQQKTGTSSSSTMSAGKIQHSVTATASTSTPKPVSVNHVEPTQVWTASVGQTLRDTIFVWAAKAECSSETRHWTVVWDTPTNYSIDAPLQFSGTFKQALTGIFELYLGADVPLYAGTNSAQCAIKVDDKPVR